MQTAPHDITNTLSPAPRATKAEGSSIHTHVGILSPTSPFERSGCGGLASASWAGLWLAFIFKRYNAAMEVVHGAKLWLIICSLCVGLLLSSLESTIVSTALVSIASDFQNYEQSNWVVIAYLVTYSSFLIIFARLSDISGRKSALLTGLAFFTIGSLACGLARSLDQLIIFRAFQGIGGSGIYALTMVVAAEITPPKQYGMVSGLIGLVFAVASAIGPVIGGAITSSTTWRWCFYLNVPTGALVIALIAFKFPARTRSDSSDFRNTLHKVDWLGCVLCLAASFVIVIPLQEGGSQLAWNSIPIIVMFVIAGLCWIALAAWEVWISYRPGEHILLPLLPIKPAAHRVVAACIVTGMLTGLAFTSTIIYLPQRFQVASGLSPVKAGVNMLPLVIISAVATIVAGFIMGKKNVCAYLIILGCALQLVGLGLNSSLHTSSSIPATAYGYQVILGIGFGTTLSSSFVLARIEIRREDIAPTMGAITQLRVFGGVLGVALCRTVLTSYLNHHLPLIVPPAMLRSITSDVASISQLPPNQVTSVRRIYGDGFSLQSRILMYIAAGNLVLSFFTFRRHAKPLKQPEADTTASQEIELEENR